MQCCNDSITKVNIRTF